METFRQFNCRILCSTDLTARGIDAENVNLVINMEVPWEHNTYLHRIGRGGRFGSHSVAVTIASDGQEMGRLQSMVSKTGSEIRILDRETIPSNVREERENMEILTPADTETKESVNDTGDDDTVPGDKKSGKVKRRGKKKSSQVDASFTSDETYNETNVPEETDQKTKDQKLLRDHIELLKSREIPKMPSWEQIEEVAEKMTKNEKFEPLMKVESLQISEETNTKIGEAVDRLSARRNDELDQKLKIVRGKTSQLSLKEMLKLVESGANVLEENNDVVDESVQSETVQTAEEEEEEDEEASTSSSDGDSSDSESDSSSTSSSSTDSDSDDSSSESEDNNVLQGMLIIVTGSCNVFINIFQVSLLHLIPHQQSSRPGINNGTLQSAIRDK